METDLTRRQTIAALALAPVARAARGQARIRAFDHTGAPASMNALKALLAISADGRPFELLPRITGEGTATLELPNQKFELMMPLTVRGFGDLYLYADDGGALYRVARVGGRELLLNYEFARSRAAFVRRYVKAAQAEGVVFGAQVRERLERGETALTKATAARDVNERAGYSNDSLAETMWAGEMASVERARDRIRRNGPRPGFLFGCNAFQYHRSEEYARQYNQLLNFATLPFYRARTEPKEGQPDYSQVDAILAKLAGTGIVTKGHPLVWFHRAGVPEFLKGKSWDDLRASCRDFILRGVSRYRDRIHAWDVINEAHDWANDLNLSHEQLVELTKLAAQATREADPTAFRVVNSCCTWSEYVATRRTYSGPLGRRANTVLDYVQACENANVQYEAIGLQVYYPRRDMLEIERQLERFFRFNKPIHITELGISSSSEPQKAGEEKVPSRAVWHGEQWTEQIQADWAEQFYTICYSKPLIQAITWWDFSDPAFIAHGGMLTPDRKPKEIYRRLSQLIKKWGIGVLRPPVAAA
jgi:GH35 family endo-1,4-beta-xylanase